MVKVNDTNVNISAFALALSSGDMLQVCEVVREIRRLKNHCNQDTPIVALTAHTDAGNEKKYLASGFQRVLTKPLQPEQARKLLSELQDMKLKLMRAHS